MNILTTPVAELVPHSPPMVLLDRILSENPEGLVAEVQITENSRFFDPQLGGVASWVGIEYMAQAIAAFAGIHALRRGEPVKLGFLLGSRKYQMAEPCFRLGQSYQVAVEQLYMDDSGLGSFDCQIRCQESLCVTAKLNVFETDDAKQMIEK